MSSMFAARPVATSRSLGLELGGLLALRSDREGHAALAGLDAGDVEAGRCHDRHPALGERALDDLAHLGVLERDDLRQVLEQGHADTDVVEHAGELDPDRAGADDDDVLGRLVARNTSSLVTIWVPSGSSPASDLTREPVARITSVAWSTVRRPCRACRPRRAG